MKRVLAGLGLAAAALVLLFFGRITDIYCDWLWFGEVGYRSVFLTLLKTKIAAGLAGGVVTFVVLYVNWLVAARVSGGAADRPSSPAEILFREKASQRVGRIAPWACLAVAVLAGSAVSRQWNSLLLAFCGQPVGAADPLLGMDIAFFLFTLPVLKGLQAVCALLLFLGVLPALAVYIPARAVRFEGGLPRLDPGPSRHLHLLAALLLAVLACRSWLDRYGLLLGSEHVVFGATYADAKATLPALTLLAAACLAAAVFLVLIAVRRAPSRRETGAIAAGVFLVYAAGRVAPHLLQRLVVLPNEIAMERPYIERNIAMTREAFGLSGVEERLFPAESSLAPGDLPGHADTLDNIRIWDYRPLYETFGQLQEIRPYYRFAGVDSDRYWISGRYRQVMLSARELDSLKLSSRIWINENLTYTHGYGLVMGHVNDASPEGQPKLLIRDIPPVAAADLEVARPEIYFGELTHGWVVVNTQAKEFDYPRGDENAYCEYAGRGGIPLSSLLRRLALSMKVRSLKMLLSSDVSARSRVLLMRNILQRAAAIAPFIGFDNDPYLVLAGGRLVWILDGYTRSRSYPYSTPMGGINYIRNSVKATVDAYDGAIRFYANDSGEPILRAYARAFPGLFRPIDEMPRELRAHLRVPRGLFDLQSQTFARYHMADPQVFYNQEDLWAGPNEVLSDKPVRMESYYTIMRLPGEERAEYVLMTPFTPAGRDNLIAWMAARSDPPHSGELLVFRFPKDRLVYGPMQIEARMNQDRTISQQFTLWGQKDNRIIKGNMQVIPVGRSLVYVKPVYLQSQHGGIPELKSVVAAYGDSIAMEASLPAALWRAVSQPVPFRPSSPGGRRTPLDALQRARERLRGGDYAGCAAALDDLEAAIGGARRP
ncbi:MAG: UPF0182 family protein [Elusimicrobiota bacterium]